MKRGDYLGMPVRLVESRIIPIEHLPGSRMSRVEFTTEDEFVVEHDFRNTEESGIRVGCPDGSWMSLTSEQFAQTFGTAALVRLDAIEYEEGDAR